MREYIVNQIRDSYETKMRLMENAEILEVIKKVAEVTIEAYRSGKKTLIAGNGGSAADAQHMAGEFVSRFYFDRPGLPALALTTDTSILTAIGNDYGYERVFARQIQANGNEGDIFFGISTSGNSPNVVAAIEECKKKGIVTVGLVGAKACKMDELCDYIIKIPSTETPRIQESHLLIEHMICALVEEAIFGRGF
ncbi:D-sedoheptulose-7-phosphate isomerase [Cellulosilyticum ruminicola]|uniref:D-sedoheptulose-7-phosphate isomerase n=1 Tax=Cellulosilyticum ruminicola TaxID=425254 RepID=UPI000B1C8E73|nr:D-sedoheptulose 7-phosphate isomerase [Cellulosilyticum ruminicola]